MSRPPVPLAQIERRIPEAGRIRLGVKTAKAMKSIDTFRFTSQDKSSIEQIAALYGGTVEPWRDPKANPPDQWQVITTSNRINIAVPPDALSIWYELWAGGGCQRRCDGLSVEVSAPGPDGDELQQQRCICAAKGVLECDPMTRLNVILDGVSFRGVWRLQTKGWNALKEMPGMIELIENLQPTGMVLAELTLEKRTAQQGRKKFVVPKVSMANTPSELADGKAALGALVELALPPAAAPSGTLALPRGDAEAELIIEDAEVIELPAQYADVADCADHYGVDAKRLWNAINSVAAGDEARIADAIHKMKQGTIQPIGFFPDGRVQWGKS
jgi:Recombination directionality factor-like